MRAVGEQDRTRLRHRHRQTVRHGTSRRTGGGPRVGGAAPVETVFRATVGERVLAGVAVGRLAPLRAYRADPRIRPGYRGRGIPDDAGDHGADGGDDGAGWVRGGDYYANMGR